LLGFTDLGVHLLLLFVYNLYLLPEEFLIESFGAFSLSFGINLLWFRKNLIIS